MIKLEIKLRINNKNEIPEILEEIAEKAKSGIDMSNTDKYFFKLIKN